MLAQPEMACRVTPGAFPNALALHFFSLNCAHIFSASSLFQRRQVATRSIGLSQTVARQALFEEPRTLYASSLVNIVAAFFMVDTMT